MCGVRRAEATLRPQLGHETQHGVECSTASGARWQMQSHASPGGGVGTNFVKARSRLGSPRMPQHTSRTGTAEGGSATIGDCNAWRSAYGQVLGTYGQVNASGVLWTKTAAEECGASNRLYCFEK